MDCQSSHSRLRPGHAGIVQLGYRPKDWWGTWIARRHTNRANTPNTANLAVRFMSVLFIQCLRTFGVWAFSPVSPPAGRVGPLRPLPAAKSQPVLVSRMPCRSDRGSLGKQDRLRADVPTRGTPV